ncbi:Carnitine deficiency-associated protein 3-like protein [Euroglyphus maynei]|uniref:Carnitine deficiency-associated protein 3-like protein n=1 Tax=Euroglyphus maynei TaxID=6958 RepID=A0A1Y3AT12_EURMA|nr:Carnitine deficiency-associated protein 3-like protein [Euroglyphus maynei]
MSGDLDDFFAKKDKKKKKSKGISSEDFVQKYEFKCKENESRDNTSGHLLSNLESFVQIL